MDNISPLKDEEIIYFGGTARDLSELTQKQMHVPLAEKRRDVYRGFVCLWKAR